MAVADLDVLISDFGFSNLLGLPARDFLPKQRAVRLRASFGSTTPRRPATAIIRGSPMATSTVSLFRAPSRTGGDTVT